MKRSNPIAIRLSNQSPVGGLGQGSRTHGFTFRVYQHERPVLTMRSHISKTCSDPSSAAKELLRSMKRIAEADPWSVLLNVIGKECQEGHARFPNMWIEEMEIEE